MKRNLRRGHLSGLTRKCICFLPRKGNCNYNEASIRGVVPSQLLNLLQSWERLWLPQEAAGASPPMVPKHWSPHSGTDVVSIYYNRLCSSKWGARDPLGCGRKILELQFVFI